MRVNTAKLAVLCGAVNGALAIGLGAFGAHALRGQLSPRLLNAYQTAADYHLVHAVVLLVFGVLCQQKHLHVEWARRALRAFLFGLVLFCGSLYSLAITGVTGLGMVTPVGGLALITAWCCLGAAAWFANPHV